MKKPCPSLANTNVSQTGILQTEALHPWPAAQANQLKLFYLAFPVVFQFLLPSIPIVNATQLVWKGEIAIEPTAGVGGFVFISRFQAVPQK